MAVIVNKSKCKRGHAKALPRINLDLPGRLYVGHLMSYFNVSHSTVYDHLRKEMLPQPTGYSGKRPYWSTQAVKSALEG